VLHEEALDLGWVGVEAADDEHVLLAADDPQAAPLERATRILINSRSRRCPSRNGTCCC